MTASQEIIAIADGLTEAQRKWVAHPGNDRNFWCDDLRTANALQGKRLIDRLDRTNRAAWTGLGLKVRAYVLNAALKSGGAG